MTIVPITLKDAVKYVKAYHRHNTSPQGWKFGCALVDADQMIGVGIAGRPVARHMDDGVTVEITRLCVRGDKNACSMLYGRLKRASKALGYVRAVTYTRIDEPGTSLRASGFKLVRMVPAETWDRPGRRRIDKAEIIDRQLWEVSL